MAQNIKIYTMEYCPYCVRAKKLLVQRNISYEEITLSDDDDAAWDALTAKSGLKTAPQIFQGDKLIGGYTELAALDAKDQLQSLKAE